MRDFQYFTNKLKEHAVYDLNLSQFDNYFDDIKNSEKTLKSFSKEMNILKDMYSQIEIDDILLMKQTNEYYKLDFGSKIRAQTMAVLSFYTEIMKKNEKIIEKINNDFYNGGVLSLDFEIDVEPVNFNKIHFPINLPTNFKNIGLGKKIFEATIDKLKYTITSSHSSSIDAKFTFRSLTKNINYYSFIKDQHILIFSSNQIFNDIKDILMDWFSVIEYDNVILDKDFYKKHQKEIKEDEYINKIYKDFKNKYSLD